MIPTSPSIPGVSKLGVLRPGAIGDVIVTLPALEALRRTYLFSEIVLLGRPWCQGLLGGGRTVINRFITVPGIPGINEGSPESEEQGINEFKQQLTNESFDILINFQGKGVSANPFIKDVGAGLTVSFCGDDAEPADISIPYFFEQAEVNRFLELVSRLGAAPVLPDPRIRVLPQDEQSVLRLFPFVEDHPFVVIHPMATDIRRSWPLEHYRTVIRHLLNERFKIILSGDKSDKHHLTQLRNLYDENVYNAGGLLQLNELGALMKKSAFVIAPDTGPLHLARAVGAATIGLYWAPNFINWGPLIRRNNRAIISWDMHCPFCGVIPNQPYPFEPRDQCDHNISFIRNISPDRVISEINDLLTTVPQTLIYDHT